MAGGGGRFWWRTGGAIALSSLILLPGAAATGCMRQDLGSFSMCVPPTWQLAKSGIDSAAGRFTTDGLQVSYDFGLNSDPLLVPANAVDAHESTISVGGLPARRVSYSVQRSEGVPMHYLGVHIAEVHRSSMGRLKLTLRAYAQDQTRFVDMDALLSTIQFTPPPSR